MTPLEIEMIRGKILELIESNVDGVSLNTIIDYLDYVNRVVYSEEELAPIIKKLLEEERIYEENNLFKS